MLINEVMEFLKMVSDVEDFPEFSKEAEDKQGKQCKHRKHIVNDTRKRSIIKALTGRALEISIGTFIISYFILHSLEKSLTIAVLNEALCAVTSYINDRVWNLSQWGRKVMHK